jgi:hypothetical protein
VPELPHRLVAVAGGYHIGTRFLRQDRKKRVDRPGGDVVYFAIDPLEHVLGGGGRTTA